MESSDGTSNAHTNTHTHGVQAAHVATDQPRPQKQATTASNGILPAHTLAEPEHNSSLPPTDSLEEVPPQQPAAVGLDESATVTAEDGTCRTSSAYILLQLRDLGRSASTPESTIDTQAAAPPVTTTTTTAATPAAAAGSCASTSPHFTLASADHAALTTAAIAIQQSHHYQQQQRQQRQRQQQQRDLQVATRPANDGGVQVNVSPAVSPASARGGFGSGEGGAAGGAGGTRLAFERGMYVAGLLPGFQGSAPSPVAPPPPPAATSPTAPPALLPQLPTQIPRPPSSLPSSLATVPGGGSAALRPICPKRTADTVMVISPTTGQLVPVSVFTPYEHTCYFFLCIRSGASVPSGLQRACAFHTRSLKERIVRSRASSLIEKLHSRLPSRWAFVAS